MSEEIDKSASRSEESPDLAAFYRDDLKNAIERAVVVTGLELKLGCGRCVELADNLRTRGFLSRIPTKLLKNELRIRNRVAPIMQIVESIMEFAKTRGIDLDPERLVYERYRSRRKDTLEEPGIFVGYNVSDMTLEQILEESRERLKGRLRGQHPCGEKTTRIVWTDKFMIDEDVWSLRYDKEFQINRLLDEILAYQKNNPSKIS